MVNFSFVKLFEHANFCFLVIQLYSSIHAIIFLSSNCEYTTLDETNFYQQYDERLQEDAVFRAKAPSSHDVAIM
jgi:spermidine synthase